jgi:hypothetical protein
VRYLGTIYVFVMLNTILDTPAARSAIALANANLQQSFGKYGRANSLSQIYGQRQHLISCWIKGKQIPHW